MRWGRTHEQEEEHREGHTWFAWYPVRLTDTGQWCWLERVWRTLEVFHGMCEVWWEAHHFENKTSARLHKKGK